jgi:hypothetical protein
VTPNPVIKIPLTKRPEGFCPTLKLIAITFGTMPIVRDSYLYDAVSGNVVRDEFDGAVDARTGGVVLDHPDIFGIPIDICQREWR